MVQRLLGKTALSIEIAKQIDGEIISADSMQIYKEMNIGSAKPTTEEMQGIKHYLLDFVSPKERYSVADYKKQATKAIEEILKKTSFFVDFSIKFSLQNKELGIKYAIEKERDVK